MLHNNSNSQKENDLTLLETLNNNMTTTTGYLDININNLKKKKRGIVNIKALKEAMKFILIKNSKKISNDDELLLFSNDKNIKQGKEKEKQKEKEMGKENSVIGFQNLCSNLIHSETIEQNTKSLLTIPNCFMTILHLSTQMGLELKRINDTNFKNIKTQTKTQIQTQKNNANICEMNETQQLTDFFIFYKK